MDPTVLQLLDATACECCRLNRGTLVLILPPYDNRPAAPFLTCRSCATGVARAAR